MDKKEGCKAGYGITPSLGLRGLFRAGLFAGPQPFGYGRFVIQGPPANMSHGNAVAFIFPTDQRFSTYAKRPGQFGLGVIIIENSGWLSFTHRMVRCVERCSFICPS